MLERVALAAGRVPSLALVVFAASLVDARRAPPPVVPVAEVAAPAAGPPAPAPVEEVPPPTGSWPRLTGDGFAGMTGADMASIGAVIDAFPGAVLTPRWSAQTLELDPPVRAPLALVGRVLGFGGPDHYAAIEVADGRATRVTVTRPGVVTEHDVQVGDPLAGVLRVRGAHCALGSYFSHGRQMFVPFVRCRVPAGEGELRYDASAPELLVADDLSLAPRPPIPRGGRAFARWIVDQRLVIAGIMWEPRGR